MGSPSPSTLPRGGLFSGILRLSTGLVTLTRVMVAFPSARHGAGRSAGGGSDTGDRDAEQDLSPLLVASFEEAAARLRLDALRCRIAVRDLEDLLWTVRGDVWIRRHAVASAACPVRTIRAIGRRTIRSWKAHGGGRGQVAQADPKALSDGLSRVPDAQEPIEQLVAVEERHLLYLLLRRAPEGQRRVLLAHFAEGKRIAEIAGELGVTPMAVSLRLRRGLAGLKRLSGD